MYKLAFCMLSHSDRGPSQSRATTNPLSMALVPNQPVVLAGLFIHPSPPVLCSLSASSSSGLPTNSLNLPAPSPNHHLKTQLDLEVQAFLGTTKQNGAIKIPVHKKEAEQ